jgi:hypothetical protein
MKAIKLVLIAFILLLLQPGPVTAQEYVSGLSVTLENYPVTVTVGETFTMTVRIVNGSDTDVSGLLRTYIYSTPGYVYYPSTDNRTSVVLNENGSSPNLTDFSVGPGENNIYELSLTLKSDITLISESGAIATLRARIGTMENGSWVDLAQTDRVNVVVLPKPGPEAFAPVKLTAGLLFTVAIVYSVKIIQKENKKNQKRVKASRRHRKPS